MSRDEKSGAEVGRGPHSRRRAPKEKKREKCGKESRWRKTEGGLGKVGSRQRGGRQAGGRGRPEAGARAFGDQEKVGKFGEGAKSQCWVRFGETGPAPGDVAGWKTWGWVIKKKKKNGPFVG